MSVTMAVVTVSVIGLLGAAVLVIASQFLKVEENPRVEQVKEELPGVNCGACGYAGCADYAEAVAGGEDVGLCVPGGSDTAAKLAGIMGGEAGDIAVMKAVCACKGTNDVVEKRFHYTGIETCTASANLHGGVSSCPYGCLGFGDCKAACRFGAIVIENGLARVIPEKCTGCGACAIICPKHLFWVREETAKPVVKCENRQRGAITRKECSAGCIACKKCEKICPEDAIHVINNVARIDLGKCTGCYACVKECPVSVIEIPKVG